MSVFDSSSRGVLTLLLSRNDPLDSCYLTPEGTVLYRVATQRANTGRGRPNAQVTTVQRFRSRPAPEPRTATSVGLGFGSTGSSDIIRRRRTQRRRSSQTPSLATISEDTDVSHSSSSSGDEYTNTIASSGTPLVVGGREGRGISEDVICIATIEKRPFSLAPVVVTFQGKEQIAAKYMRKEATFSSSRRYDSLVGESMVWKLSTPTPKLYDSNKTRIAKYRRPFVPDSKGFSSKTATLELSAEIESDVILDEIIVTLLLSQVL